MNDTHSVIVLVVGFIGAVAAIVTVALACIWSGTLSSCRTDNRDEPDVLWGLYYLDPVEGRTEEDVKQVVEALRGALNNG